MVVKIQVAMPVLSSIVAVTSTYKAFAGRQVDLGLVVGRVGGHGVDLPAEAEAAQAEVCPSRASDRAAA